MAVAGVGSRAGEGTGRYRVAMRRRRHSVVVPALFVIALAAACVPAGNPDGTATIPAGAGAVDTSDPDRVIGNGTPASCTSAAVVSAVALGGIITFDCGPDPITITMAATAKIVNNTGPEIVIDGGGKVTLSGGGVRRILYMNTCDQAQVWTTAHCQNQDHPRLTIQNLTFVDGNSTGQTVRRRRRRRRLRARRPGARSSTPASSATGARPPGPTSAAAPSGC